MNPRLVGKCLRVSFLSVATMLIADCFFQAPVHAASTLMIGEVAWAGSSLSSADEWLELWNNSSVTTSLAGYKLRGAASSDLAFRDADSIPPYGTFIISNYSGTDTKSVLNTPAQFVTTAVSLPNDKLQIQLIAPDGSVIDTAGDGKAPPAGSSSLKVSMIRNGDTWISAASAVNLDAGVPDLATPDVCDGCSPPPPPPPPAPEPTPVPIPVPVPDPEPVPTTDPEPVIEAEPVVETVATTTEVITADTTTTDALPPEPLVGTSGTEFVVQEEPVPPLDLRLSAVFPAPSAGKEWVEILALNASGPTQAMGWSVKDGSSTIFRFTNETIPFITGNGMTWHIELASAHLNNGGDSVELIRPDGSVAERMTYPSTAKDKRWIKNADATAWIIDPPDTPAQAPSAATSSESIDEPPTIELPVASTTIKATGNAIKATGDAKAGTPSGRRRIASSTDGVPNAAGPVAKKTTGPAATKPKPKTTKKITPVLTINSFKDMSSLESGVRVRVSGVVATAPGIIAKQQFIIVTPDGHGLWIRASNRQPSPKAGTRIQIEGTLMNNDDGLYLKLGTKDTWKEISGDSIFQPRIVDLLDPLADDAWSFVQVTGTVTDIRGQTVELDLNGVPVEAKIKPATRYRTARIKKGDQLGLRGVLDIRGESPAIIPSVAADIQLTAHVTSVSEGRRPLPDWLPFGAAGMTIAVTEGAKRLHRVFRDRKLRSRLKVAADH